MTLVFQLQKGNVKRHCAILHISLSICTRQLAVEWSSVVIMSQNIGGDFVPSDAPHIPVLLAEVLTALSPLSDTTVVDGTFGAGGYSRAMLEGGSNVIGVDRDPNVAPFVAKLSADFEDEFSFVQGEFSQLDTLIKAPVDAIVLDIGVSSMQLDTAERGFSFMRDGPLDMRMSGAGTSAADLVNELSEGDLASLLFTLGEEKRSRRIAAAIVGERANGAITSTGRLAELVEATVGRKPGASHPATKSFQALRIAVNGEFDQLVEGLFAAERLLGEDGILAVVTFHSLEDRIVKRFFSPEKAAPTRSRFLPAAEVSDAVWADVVKPVKAGKDELDRNPRARSATLRYGRRTSAPAREIIRKGLGVPGFSLPAMTVGGAR